MSWNQSGAKLMKSQECCVAVKKRKDPVLLPGLVCYVRGNALDSFDFGGLFAFRALFDFKINFLALF